MKVDVLTLGPVGTNCYVVSENGSCLVIDPADRADRIIDHLNRNGLTCKGVLLTHGHFDHISATDKLCSELGVDYYIHEEDSEMLQNPTYNASYYFGCQMTVSTPPCCFYGMGTKLMIDCFDITVYETPGHSKGSVCYHIGNNLFCGDLLFYSSCGRTDLHGGDGRKILSSISSVVKKFDDDTVIYPGHDREFTLKEAKENNYIIINYGLADRQID